VTTRTASRTRSRFWRAAIALVLVTVATAAGAAPALAGTGGASSTKQTGGVVYAPKPRIAAVECRSSCAGSSSRYSVSVKPNSILRIRGNNLADAREVSFLGGKGNQDDTRARARKVTATRLQVRVPANAASGPIRVITSSGVRSASSPTTVIVVSETQTETAPTDGEQTEAPVITSGSFIWPVKNFYFSSPFGQRWGRLHAGVDLALPAGSPIYAAADGTVTHVGWAGGYGNLTCIVHRFAAPIAGQTVWSTCYAHQSAFGTTVGAIVKQGQEIGKVGCTGSCTGDHVHFEIREGEKMYGTPHDPVPFLPPRASKSTKLGPPLDLLPEH
jgi:murein DD-endopeptidase MepM/ murein hydrolase activator NlpD